MLATEAQWEKERDEGGHTGGPSGACVSVRHLTTSADSNNDYQKGESDRAKGMWGEETALCFDSRSNGAM